MPIPIVVWYVAAAAAGAIALRAVAAGRKAALELQPKPFAKPRIAPAVDVVTQDFGIKVGRIAQHVSFPASIPADVLAAVASRLLYAGPFDEYVPEMKRLANAGAAAAEQHRGNIRNRMWKGIAAGVDGFGFTSSQHAKQNLRFNSIAVAIQDVLGTYTPPPSWWTSGHMLAPGHFPIGQLSIPAQNLVFRYQQVVYGIECDLWDQKWTQGHTTAQIFARSPNTQAVGTSEAACEAIQEQRIGIVGRLLKAMAADGMSDDAFQTTLAAALLVLAKRKIVSWPGGPASKPYVDWGWIIGWLVRAYVAAQSGQVEELAALGEEAGAKAREWGARPPGDDYGSAELASDLQSYAGSLASGT